MEHKCPDCNGFFQSFQELCAHYNDCHGSKTSSSNVKNKKFQCNLCDYGSDKNWLVKRHMKLMHDEGKQYTNSRTNQNTSFIGENYEGNNVGVKKGVVISSNEDLGMNRGCDKKYDIRLKENFKLFVSGPSRCGKTFFVSDIIENIRGFAKQPPSIIIYVYTVWQSKFDEMRSMIDYFMQDDGDITEKIKKIANGKPTLVVFDDLINSKSLSGIAKLFTVDARHMNLSLIFLSQRLFVNDEYFRQISQNSDYFAIFKNPRNSMEIRNLAQQMTPGKLDLVNYYMEATVNPFSYLFINVTQECPPRSKYLSALFDKDFVVKVHPSNNEILVNKNRNTEVWRDRNLATDFSNMYLVNSNTFINEPPNSDVIRDFAEATEQEDNYLKTRGKVDKEYDDLANEMLQRLQRLRDENNDKMNEGRKPNYNCEDCNKDKANPSVQTEPNYRGYRDITPHYMDIEENEAIEENDEEMPLEMYRNIRESSYQKNNQFIDKRRENRKKKTYQFFTKPPTCPLCKKTFPTDKILKYHMKECKDVAYTCQVCNENFKSIKSLERHMATWHDDLNAGYDNKRKRGEDSDGDNEQSVKRQRNDEDSDDDSEIEIEYSDDEDDNIED